ncbi:MAG: NAD(P)/FAD-dependent oxidoreductase [Oscillospiraceae bacterium]|nr:NAD(P)/FAD-dependent oxidoreductase [Oscillospiraceae bacterium]
MYDYDVIFIGSGHSCNHAAIALAMSGKKTAFVEMGKIGGTCTNFGCDAKILLDGPFEYLEGLERYQGLCTENRTEIDWSALMQYKKQNIGMFDPILNDIFSKMGIDIIRAQGKLLDAHTVQAGDRTVTAEYIVIGTGQRNARLDIEGKEYLHGSSDFLDLDAMPERLVFIGAGIISMEFASMALALGKKVTLIEFAPRALASYPEQYVDKLVKKMESQGAVFKFGEAVSEAVKSENGFIVRTKSGFSTECDYILDATGRIANVENLGLEELGIKASRRGIEVDDHLRTAVPNIFASGDVIDKKIPKLTPTAEFESNYIASQILGLNPAPIAYPVIPNLVFTLPRIAQVGVTVAEAGQNPDEYHIVSVPYGQQNEWIANRETDAELTYIFDKENYLVGAVIYGSEAGTWIDFLTLIINQKMTALQLRSMIFAFPTPTYMLISSLIPLLKQM